LTCIRVPSWVCLVRNSAFKWSITLHLNVQCYNFYFYFRSSIGRRWQESLFDGQNQSNNTLFERCTFNFALCFLIFFDLSHPVWRSQWCREEHYNVHHDRQCEYRLFLTCFDHRISSDYLDVLRLYWLVLDFLATHTFPIAFQ
jgi:hypothetical protein